MLNFRRTSLATAFCGILLLSACTAQQINQTLGDVLETGSGSPTTSEVASGLKQALEKGTLTGTRQASQENGYFGNPRLRIPFPEDVQKVETRLRQLGFGNQVDEFVLTLNRGAEKAAIEAKPIFIDAIRQMTIQDAWNILRGDDDAATQYLRRTTGGQLEAKFRPVISDALKSTNATKYYSDLVSTYNRIPGVSDVNPDLESYATEKAIDGLFLLIADEEKNIRENPVARTTELLRKVFGQVQ